MTEQSQKMIDSQQPAQGGRLYQYDLHAGHILFYNGGKNSHNNADIP